MVTGFLIGVILLGALLFFANRNAGDAIGSSIRIFGGSVFVIGICTLIGKAFS